MAQEIKRHSDLAKQKTIRLLYGSLTIIGLSFTRVGGFHPRENVSYLEIPLLFRSFLEGWFWGSFGFFGVEVAALSSASCVLKDVETINE